MKKFDIRKTFDIFLREPISVLTEGLFQLVNIENNIFSQKPYIGIDFVNNKDHQNQILDTIENRLVDLGKLAPNEAQKLHEKRINK